MCDQLAADNDTTPTTCRNRRRPGSFQDRRTRELYHNLFLRAFVYKKRPGQVQLICECGVAFAECNCHLLLAGNDEADACHHPAVAEFRDNQSLNLRGADQLTLSGSEMGMSSDKTGNGEKWIVWRSLRSKTREPG